MEHLVLVEMKGLGCYQIVARGIAKDAQAIFAIVMDHSVVLELFTQGPVQMEDPQHLEGSESTRVILHRLK
jgi:hypothetical protein